MYREDYDVIPYPPRYREYYERDLGRYGERERHSRGYSPTQLDDHYYRGLDRGLDRGGTTRREDSFPPPIRGGRGRDLAKGAYVQGSVTLAPPPPFQSAVLAREKPTSCNTVFVGTIPEGTTEKHLYDIFCECGPIQDVRIARNKTYGHVEFRHEGSVDKAIQLNRYTVYIVTPSGEEYSAAIQVDYAQSRELSDAKRRMKSGDLLPFNAANAQIISSDLRNDDTFEYAARNLIQWIEKGNCTSTTAGTFFGLMSSVNNHGFKLEKEMKARDRDEEEFYMKKRSQLQQLVVQCGTLEAVFDAAFVKKAWDHFTKPQRKSLTQWKEHMKEVETSLKTNIKKSIPKKDDTDEPDPKKPKIEDSISGTTGAVELERKLSRAEQEIDQLKIDHEVAVEKKEKQILQLKTLLAKFKKNCPEEWEKIVGGSSNTQQDQDQQQGQVTVVDSSESEEQVVAKEESGDEGDWEVIDGVSMDDLNRALDNGSVGGESLAAAAAAYAQLRTQMGSTVEENTTGLSDTDIALISVMAAFLTVHPLGASLEEIEMYFRTLNSTYNSIYLESLLHRLPGVFQLSQGADKKPRWWFMGFQTVSVSQYATPGQGAAVLEQELEQNDTVEMIDVVTVKN